MSDLQIYKNEIDTELKNPEVQRDLIATTFKGLDANKMKMAMFEGMVRGFTFKDFLEKNVYAVPFGGGYSLITSIDYARKIGMKNGVVGKGEPIYEDKIIDGRPVGILSCSVTIKKKIGETIGEFTAKVYFDEYYAGNKDAFGNVKTGKYGDIKPTLWDTKPRTMIAKVAEMHSLRMACPEDLAKAYVEEEIEMEKQKVVTEVVDESKQKALDAITTIPDLKKFCDENKGGGKVLAKAIIERKKAIEELLKTNPQSDVKGS